jgi:hypothetical protein
MASTGDIERVRLNTDEPSNDTYSDDEIGALVDSDGVAGATAIIWEQKAANYSKLVNTTEAGASHNFSDLRKAALEMAEWWEAKALDEAEPTTSTGRVRVRKIVRS